MSYDESFFLLTKTFNEGDPDAVIIFDPKKVSAMKAAGLISPTVFENEDLSLFNPPKSFTMNELITYMALNVMNIINSTVSAAINAQVHNRNSIVKQMVMDAWVRARKDTIGDQINDYMQELRQMLPLDLTAVRQVSELVHYNGMPNTPLDILHILFQGIVKCSEDQRDKVGMNMLHFKNLVCIAAEALKTDLIHVCAIQHNGPENFAEYLTNSDNVIKVYMTPNVQEMMRVARLKSDGKIKAESLKLVKVCMHDGDWRIWPRMAAS